MTSHDTNPKKGEIKWPTKNESFIIGRNLENNCIPTTSVDCNFSLETYLNPVREYSLFFVKVMIRSGFVC